MIKIVVHVLVVVVAVCQTEATPVTLGSTSLLYAIEPILRLCNVKVYSHRCTGLVNINPIDSALETEGIQNLIDMGIPLQYMLLPCVEKPPGPEFLARRSSRCETNLVFLEPTRDSANAHIEFIGLQIATAFKTRHYTDRDFTVLVYEASASTMVALPANSWYDLLPDNLMLLPTQVFKTRNSDVRYIPNVIGVAKVYCSESQLLCFRLYYVGGLVETIQSEATDKWLAYEQYMRIVGSRSSYAVGPNYNFNKAKILINTQATSTTPFAEHLAKSTSYRNVKHHLVKPDVTQSLYLFEYHRIWILSQIFEDVYNATVKDVTFETANKTIGPIFPLLLVYPGFTGDHLRHNARLIRKYVRNAAFCLDKAKDELDLLTILNPMDRWSWISVCVTMVTLGLMFWRLTHSPFLNLVAMLFAQGNGDPVKRFSGLVVLWSFTGMLLNSGISSLIGSFLVVPPVIKGLDDYQQLYEQGYKVVIIDNGPERDKFVLQMATSPIPIGDNSVQEILTSKPYFLRIQEEVEVLPRFTTSAKMLHDHLTTRGKRCVLTGNTVAPKLVEFYSENIPGYSVFSIKEPLGHYPHQWIIYGPNAAVLYGALQAQIASGLIDYHEEVVGFSETATLRYFFDDVLKEQDPFYVTKFYFQIQREHVPYLFTVRNAQGKLVFLIWLAGVVLSSLGIVFEHEWFWRQMKRFLLVGFKQIFKCVSYTVTVFSGASFGLQVLKRRVFTLSKHSVVIRQA